MLETGADALELDYKTDARRAHDMMKDRAVFIGNVDPSAVLALGTPQLVAEKTSELLAIFADTPRFILNAGCAIPPTTPPENLHAMIRTRRLYDRLDWRQQRARGTSRSARTGGTRSRSPRLALVSRDSDESRIGRPPG